jgi:hypothetical protein
MMNLEMKIDQRPGRIALLLILALAATACDDNLDLSFPRPDAPFGLELFDIVEGPVDRASAFDLVTGRGFGLPRGVRVDQTVQWDIVFAVIDGEAVWLPRGFFEGIELSSGIRVMEGEFEDVTRVPDDRDLYELEQPVPVTVGITYAVRSRSDPTLSLPCHIYSKLVVDSIVGDPARVNFRFLWNPNCDDTNVSPGQGF